MIVSIFSNLVARDGRGCVEVRQAQPLNDGYFAAPRATIYSCSYDPLGQNVAEHRAIKFCINNTHEVVTHSDCKNNRRAVWQ